MAVIPSFQFSITGASGSQGLLGPKNGWRAYVFPRGANASQDSTGTLITFDSAAIASRFAANNWIQVGLSTDNQRRVSAAGGNSLSVAGSAVTVAENDRIFLIGNTQPTVVGGSATYTIPNTLIRQRGDDAADLYTNSMITSNSDGLIRGYATPNKSDVLIQDGNQANQGYIADLEVGTVEGVSVIDSAILGSSVTINNLIVSRFGVASGVSLGGAIRVVDGVRFTTIQAAIDDLSAAGGVVDARGFSGSLAAGITISTPCSLLLGAATITGSANPLISIATSNCSIIGLGYNITTIQNTAVDANVIRIAAGVSNTTIRGVLIDAGGKTIVEADYALGNCIYAAGTSVSEVSGVNIRECRFIDGHNGVALVFPNNSIISDNVFDFSHDALSQLFLRRAINCTVTGNVFRDTGSTSNAIWINTPTDDPSLYNTISANSIQGEYGAEAINCFGAYTTISGNAVTILTAPSGSAGIAVAQDIGHTVNTVHHNSVVGNVIRMTGSVGGTGINVLDNGTPSLGSNDNTISGNVITTSGPGISLGNSCSRNVVTGNRVDIESGATSDGIIANGTGNFDSVIVGNVVTDASRHGIHINTALRAAVNSNVVRGSVSNGIHLANSDNATMVGNVLSGNSGSGATISATRTLNIIDGLNSAVGNTTSGVNRSAQSIVAVGNSITPYGSIHWIDADASYILTSTPTIGDGFDGQILTIVNIDSGSDVVALQDQGTLAGSNVRLSGASIGIGPRDSLTLYYSRVVGDWVQIVPTMNVI